MTEKYDSLFEIDNAGWKAQNKGRNLWELFREVLQNALDSDGDYITVAITTSKGVIEVKDNGSGFNDIRDAWRVFGGDKGGDPTKRGRFGRGVKEGIASAEYAEVESTGGLVTFDVIEGTREVDETKNRSEGTRVLLRNSDWSMKQMKEVWRYVNKIWVPEGVEIETYLKGGKSRINDRWEPDFSFDSRLKTVHLNAETGAMEETYRSTTVHVKSAKKAQDGRLYEMGIPVMLDCDFPYYVDVQQKIPMAEQRNEADSWWFDKSLKPKLVQAIWNYDQFEGLSDKRLKEDWFVEALDRCSLDTAKKAWVDRVIADGRKKGVVVSSDEHSDDVAERQGYQVYDAAKAGHSTGSIVRSVSDSSADVAQEVAAKEKHSVPPTPAQQDFINLAEELAERAGHAHLVFETWSWETPPNAQHRVAEHTGDGTVRLNVEESDWEEVTPANIGTVVHEIAHERGIGHDRDWQEEMQRVAGVLLAQELGE